MLALVKHSNVRMLEPCLLASVIYHLFVRRLARPSYNAYVRAIAASPSHHDPTDTYLDTLLESVDLDCRANGGK